MKVKWYHIINKDSMLFFIQVFIFAWVYIKRSNFESEWRTTWILLLAIGMMICGNRWIDKIEEAR
jgi:hypothetical protein